MNMLKRIIVGVIAIPLLLWIYFTGGTILLIALGLLTFLSSLEILKMCKSKNINLLTFNAVSSVLFLYFLITNSTNALFVIFFTMLLNGIRDVFLSNIDGASKRISASLFTVIYPAMGFAMFYKIGSDFNQILVPVLASLIWITDTGAYFAGMLIGKHRGVFKCSPNKSIEGFIGGFLFALIGASILYFIDAELFSIKMIVFLCLSVGIFGQIGDLYESLLKRDMGVKDSSGIIPGHGGVLDRFDSLLISAPIMYVLITVFM